MKKEIVLILTLFMASAFAGCGQSQNELDRELATTILSEHLSEIPISELKFASEGYKRAENDGIVFKNQDGWSMTLGFSPEGIEVFGDLVTRETRITNTIWEEPKFKLPTPITERVLSIDGIAEGMTEAKGVKEVQYTTAYIFPENTKDIVTSYIYSGRKSKSLFRKYDDGWRIED